MNKAIVPLSVLTMSLMAGCASGPVPEQQLVQSQAALRAAEEAPASTTPESKLHIQLAREQIQKANELIEDGKNERARFMLMRAESDAELALALSRSAETRNDAEQAIQRVRMLQQQAQ